MLLVVGGLLAAAATGGGAYALTHDGGNDGRSRGSIAPGDASVTNETVTVPAAETVTVPAVETVTTVVPTPIASAFVAQLGSFRVHANAKIEAARLSAAGVDAQVLRSDDYEELRDGFWVVYAGPFDTRAAATRAAEASGVEGAFGRPITAVR